MTPTPTPTESAVTPTPTPVVEPGASALEQKFGTWTYTNGNPMPEGDIVLSDLPTEEWLEPYFAFEGFDKRHQGIWKDLLFVSRFS